MVDTVQSRLKYWRVEIKGLSLRELQGRVNGRLPPDQALSLGTVSNYERPPESETAARPGPRTEFLVALKRAFPDLRIEWLLFGEGEPTELAQRLAAPDGLEAAVGPAAAREPAGGALARRVLARCPDLELLSPEASALFMGALTRYAVGEPKTALGRKSCSTWPRTWPGSCSSRSRSGVSIGRRATTTYRTTRWPCCTP